MKIEQVELEIFEIPYRAKLCFDINKGLILPENVPYVGMGASYFAVEVLKCLAFEYFLNMLLNIVNVIVKMQILRMQLSFRNQVKASKQLSVPDYFYISGSGPNSGTVHQAAQILKETTKLPFIGLSASRYN